MIDDLKVKVYKSTGENAPVIYFNTFGDEGEAVVKALKAIALPDYSLVMIAGLSWNRDLSPWPAPDVFGGNEPFEGGGDEYLRILTEEIIPQTEKNLGVVAWRGIVGYSLAGLFSLYAVTKTDVFKRATSVSGSLWYPEFKDYFLSQRINAEKVYLSLGDKECKSRNAYLKTVGENTEKIYNHCLDGKIDCVFRSNPGGHYNDPAGRTADGIKWLLSN